MKSNYLLICGFAAAGFATATAAVIGGEVRDIDGAGLPGVAVQLIELPDSTRAGYTMSDVEGRYEFKDIKTGKYLLSFTMTGMDDQTKLVEVADSDSDRRIGPVTLSENAVTLKEAVVTAVRAAVVAKEDTIEFNAGSFHTKPNATVEDLLKKLPGVDVGSDGSITSGGKTISKILVDGKEFFADDPKMATKNLPSDMVEKVQVVDRKSENARLTGVDDGEDETVINLTVKKDMNNGWFGTISGGYGTDDRYEASTTINWFKDGNQLTILGGGNNINEMGFSDMGRGRFNDFGGNNGINNSQQFGINFNVGNEEKFRVGGNVLYTHTDRDSRNRSYTQYLFPDSISTLSSGSHTRDRGHSLRAQFRMRWNITEADVLDFRPQFTMNFRNSEKQDSSILRAGVSDAEKVNSNLALKTNRGTDYNFSGRLIYTHKFLSHPGRSISAMVNYQYSNTLQKGTTWNDIEYYLKQEDSEQLLQYLDSKQWSNNAEGRLTWTEPLGDPARGNSLEFAYRASLKFNNADRFTYNVPFDDYNPWVTGLIEYTSTPAGAVRDDDISNSFRNFFTNQELQVGYKKVTKAYNLNAGFLVSPSSSESENLMDANRNIATRWVWNVAPYLRFRYKFDKTSSLMLHYRARTNQPSITQLQPVADVSDPLNIIIGNPGLKPTFTQSLMGHLNYYQAETQQSINAMINGSYSLNNIVSYTTADPATGVRTTQYENANGNWNVFGMAMLNQPFRNRHWRFSSRLQLRYSCVAGYIDERFNRSGDLMVAPQVQITYSMDLFQMSVAPKYTFGMATSSLADQPNRYTHNYGFLADASLYLPFGLEISTDLDFAQATGYSSGFDNTQWLWNAQISYSVLSDKSLTFSVRAFDLLGQKKNISRTVNANMICDNEYNDLGRYVMFGVTWKFNTLSKKQAEVNPDLWGPPGEKPGEGPGGPGGPGGERPSGPPPGMGGGMHGGGPM